MSTSTWLIVRATFTNLQPEQIIRTFVKPIVDRFQDQLDTFHFFFEPYLLLRLKAGTDVIVRDITPFVRKRLDDMNAAGVEVTADPNYTEADGYGDGWELAQKLFEIGSRSAILKAEGDAGNVSLGKEYNECKLVHTFMNQWGYTTDKEAKFHFDRTGERLARCFTGNDENLAFDAYRRITVDLQNIYWAELVELAKRIVSELRNS